MELPRTPDNDDVDPSTLVNRRMLSVSQAADYMGVHKDTIRNWIRKGLIPYVKVDHVTRIPAAAFAAQYVDPDVEVDDNAVRERLIALVTHTIGTEYNIEGVVALTKPGQSDGRTHQT